MYNFEEIITCNAEFASALRLVADLATTDSALLLTGETGTGKEVLARQIHKRSSRGMARLVPVHCAAIPEQLFESELFGHVKGAFTGATETKEGRFAAARGGTLFLDEIGEIPPYAQVKLLRVLDQRRFEPVGSTEHVPLDARIVCATNKDLETEIRAGRFRLDLYHRLCEFVITLPPLRDRLEDLPFLISAFIDEFSLEFGKNVHGISVAALGVLQRHSWPGNIRELRNIIRQAVFRCHGKIWVEDLPVAVNGGDAEVAKSLSDGRFRSDADVPTLDELERRHIAEVLRYCRGNKSRTAKLLGIQRKTLYNKLEIYGFEGTLTE